MPTDQNPNLKTYPEQSVGRLNKRKYEIPRITDVDCLYHETGLLNGNVFSQGRVLVFSLHLSHLFDNCKRIRNCLSFPSLKLIYVFFAEPSQPDFSGNNKPECETIFTAMKIRIVVFWAVIPYTDVVGYQRFGGSCCLHS